MSILARLIYNDPLTNITKKVTTYQQAVKSAEMNALLHYAKHYEGKRGNSGESLPEVMEKILNEKITGKKDEADEDLKREGILQCKILCGGRESYTVRFSAGGENPTA